MPRRLGRDGNHRDAGGRVGNWSVSERMTCSSDAGVGAVGTRVPGTGGIVLSKKEARNVGPSSNLSVGGDPRISLRRMAAVDVGRDSGALGASGGAKDRAVRTSKSS